MIHRFLADIFKNTSKENCFIKNNQVLNGILKMSRPQIFFASRNFYSGPQKKFAFRKKKNFFFFFNFLFRTQIFSAGRIFFFLEFGKYCFFEIFCPTLHLWLTYRNTFKNHENLPTCIIDFIEQDCEVSYKISKQTVRYRLSKIARTAERVLLNPNLHLWLTYQNTFKFARPIVRNSMLFSLFELLS